MTRGRETRDKETMEAGTIVRVIKVSHLISIRVGADSRSCIVVSGVRDMHRGHHHEGLTSS